MPPRESRRSMSAMPVDVEKPVAMACQVASIPPTKVK